jgi:maltooligosyltrehalose trehalohydrolase
MELGAIYDNGSCIFTVWAPFAEQLAVRLLGPVKALLPMHRLDRGYWRTSAEKIIPGSRYLIQIDNDRERPDPASFFQPEGVHGPSEVVDHQAFSWTDHSWRGKPFEEFILYELHVGTFTPEGTFAAVIPRLKDLRQLGITAIQVMPVAQFPGRRNWGYDGACPFAVQNSYGGPEGLKQLVDACHNNNLAVILDVVFNHLGPEGNYLREFGPYFTDKYRTPWGEAVNYDGPDSDELRHYFFENASYWYRHFHVDGLRLDAIHAIYDFSARPFLRELSENMKRLVSEEGRPCHLIAESDLNDVKVIKPRSMGGFGFDAQFNEDFHHALHSLLTGENQGYYADFGRIEDLAKAYRQGFVYDWRYSVYRRRHHGSSTLDRPAHQLPAFIQNHDQVGNRLLGERLVTLAGFEKAKLAAGAVLLSPYVPLLFMGEEYAEKAPFLYFADFSDPQIVEAVRNGRKKEFRAFDWNREPPDPHDPEVFLRSRLDWSLREQDLHQVMLNFYRRLLALRRDIPALAIPDRNLLQVWEDEDNRTLRFRRKQGDSVVLCLMNFSDQAVSLPSPGGGQGSRWKQELDSAAPEWSGPGTERVPEPTGETRAVLAPWSFHLYRTG